MVGGGNAARRARGGALPDPAALVAVAAGGALGALARFALTAWDALTRAGAAAFGAATTVLLVNALGSLMMGMLIAWVGAGRGHRLARPFLGVGVLGGFTTFSAYAVDARALLAAGEAVRGVGYLVATPLVAVAACLAGGWIARRLGPADLAAPPGGTQGERP